MADLIDGKPVETLDPEEENLIFHYERGSFRKREDSFTRDFATGKIKASPGFFKALVSTKANRFVFFAMIVCIALTLFLGIFRKADSDSIHGIQCRASAFSFGGNVYATVEFAGRNGAGAGNRIPLPMQFILESVNEENSVADRHSENVAYVPSEKQYVRAVFTDYDLKKIIVTVKCGGEEKKLVAEIVQR